MENKILFSRSIYFAPILIRDYRRYTKLLKKDDRYKQVEKNNPPKYLLSYITKMYNNDDLFCEFELSEEFLPVMSAFYTDGDSEAMTVVDKISIACFSTGCAFVEFHVSYKGFSLENIADFSFNFKNARKRGKNEDSHSINEVLEMILPEYDAAKAFFTSLDFKRECKMFHHICLENPIPEEELNKYMVLLRRGYHTGFSVPNFEGDFDMVFEPYEYDRWAGSQEGLVNIFNCTDNPSTDKYLTEYKPGQLSCDYRFMYLVLLNQRFSAIKLIEEIASYQKMSRKEKAKLSMETVKLKTVFSFNIVSDDQLYQSIYSKMYDVLGIDRLLMDIRDNEEQVDLLQNHEMLDNEKKTSGFLFALSVLSMFSVLVDAAGYFDRIAFLENFSTVLSFGCLSTILVVYLIWWIRYLNK